MSPPSAPFPHRTEQEEGEEVNKTNATTSSTSYGCDSFGGDPMKDAPADDSYYYEFVRWHLPKVELHAHLYGCIPVALLQEIAHERGVTLHSKYFRVVTDDDATTTNRNNNNPDAPTATFAPLPDMYNLHPRSLPDCFDMFAELSTIVNDLTAVRRITHAALQDFAHHHVAYLELRSTPKRLRYDHCHHQNVTNDGDDYRSRKDDSTPSSLCTKLEYCQAILQVMHDFQEQEQRRYDREMADYHIARRRRDDGCTSQVDDDDEGEGGDMIMGNTPFKNINNSFKQLLPRLPLVCRFLVSIDRSQSLTEAEENVNLAITLVARRQDPTLWSRLVVGLDLGGNPTRQDFETFRPCLQKARDHGLKVTLHCGEIPCNAHPKAYREASDMLDFRPDRLGHAVLLPPDLLNRLEQLQIPVETCPTSNVMTLELHHYQEQQQEQQNGDSNENNQHGDLVHGLRQHPSLRHWLRVGSKQEINGKSSSNNNNNLIYPLTIGTDDPGVFDTTATQELWLLATAFRLDRQQLSRIIVESVRFAFCDVDTQHQVQKHIRERVRAILSG